MCVRKIAEAHDMTMDEIKAERQLVVSIASSVWVFRDKATGKVGVWGEVWELSPHVPVVITGTLQRVEAVLVRETTNQVLVENAGRGWWINVGDLSPAGW